MSVHVFFFHPGLSELEGSGSQLSYILPKQCLQLNWQIQVAVLWRHYDEIVKEAEVMLDEKDTGGWKHYNNRASCEKEKSKSSAILTYKGKQEKRREKTAFFLKSVRLSDDVFEVSFHDTMCFLTWKLFGMKTSQKAICSCSLLYACSNCQMVKKVKGGKAQVCLRKCNWGKDLWQSTLPLVSSGHRTSRLRWKEVVILSIGDCNQAK